MYVSVYKLANRKYYVHRSEEAVINLDSVIESENILWLKHNCILYVIEQFPEDDMNTVDITTIRYMRRFGIMNVRGGRTRNLNLKHDDMVRLLSSLHFNMVEVKNEIRERRKSKSHFNDLFFDDLVIEENNENDNDDVDNKRSISEDMRLQNFYTKSQIAESIYIDGGCGLNTANCILCGEKEHDTFNCFYVTESRKQQLRNEEICDCNYSSTIAKYYENDITLHKRKDCKFYSSVSISNGSDSDHTGINYSQIFS